MTTLSSYTCGDNPKTFSNYDSCAASCEAVCKKDSNYSDPKKQIFGINVGGVSDEEKKLAVARAYNECYSDGSTKITKRIGGRFGPRIRVGTTYHYCCFDNPLTKDFNVVAREQLNILGHRLPSGCEKGIPFDKLQYVNFDDPRISETMRKHMNTVVDPAMLADLEQIYKNKQANTQPAKDLQSTIDDKVERSKIPGF